LRKTIDKIRLAGVAATLLFPKRRPVKGEHSPRGRRPAWARGCRGGASLEGRMVAGTHGGHRILLGRSGLFGIGLNLTLSVRSGRSTGARC
jgi:hypothetical protein